MSILKWSVAALITIINISVYCLWVPARLQINDRFIYLNAIWDRIEKVIYALFDGGLNFWFLYLVKKTFIANGMTKYRALYRFNAVAVVCSLSMDVSCYPNARFIERPQSDDSFFQDYDNWSHEPQEQLCVSLSPQTRMYLTQEPAC